MGEDMFCKLPPQLDTEIAELEKQIHDAHLGHLRPDELKASCVSFGVYEQRQSSTYMIRIRCAGGAITPAQLRTAALLAQRFGSSMLHITTRQELQLHDLLLDHIVPIIRTLKESGLTTLGGCGNSVRNVVASPSAGVDPGEPFDVSPYVFALTSRLIAEPDSYLLPRKFKIAFSNTDIDTAQAAFHDVGFIATTRNGRPGFIVFLAGGLGAKPLAGRPINEFLPAEDVYFAVEAVKRLYNQHGDRRNRLRNRLRFLWENMGEQAFLERYRFFEAEVRAENPAPLEWKPEPQESSIPLPAPVSIDSESFERWKGRYVFPHRQPGLHQVLFPVPCGDLSADQAISLSDFLIPFGPDAVRGTREQNLLLRHIPASHLGNVYELLKDWNVLVGSASFLGRAIVCTGASTCKLGICMSRPAMTAITESIAGDNLPLDDLDGFQMSLSGCPNSCGNHWTADLGFYGKAAHKGGRAYPAYKVVFGGRAREGEARLATNAGEVAGRHLPMLVREFIECFLRKKSRFDSFREYLVHEGGDDLHALCRKYGEAPDFEKNLDIYTDWGETAPFSLPDRRQVKSAAGLMNPVESNLKAAQREGCGIVEQTKKDDHGSY
jgi:sulfite reductase (ferredoxin)